MAWRLISLTKPACGYVSAAAGSSRTPCLVAARNTCWKTSRWISTTRTAFQAEASSQNPSSPEPAVDGDDRKYIIHFDEILQKLNVKDNVVRELFTADMGNKMHANKVAIAEAIKKFQRFPGDTGSPEAQVAALTARINYMIEHLTDHKKDKHSRRGLVAMVEKRRKMLQYLKRKDFAKYNEVLRELGLRPVAGLR